MKKLKALTIVLLFLIFLSTVFALGIYFIYPNYFLTTLGITYIASSVFTFFLFVYFDPESDKK